MRIENPVKPQAFNFVVLLLCFLAFASGCGNPQESARKELARLGKDFNSATFIESVSNGDKLAVKLFLAAGINVNEPMNNGTTALMAASNRADEEVVKTLLDGGADPNAQNNDGVTALMVAAGKGDQKTVQALLEKGAKANMQKPSGVTALLIAATKGNTSVVATLLGQADPNAGATVEGVTPLIAAAMGQHFDSAKLLLEKGAEVNAKDSSGLTAADYATNLNLVTLLRDHGAPVVSDYNLKAYLDEFRRDLGTQARMDMETGATPDACRNLILETLSSFKNQGFASNQLFQAHTCAFDTLGSAIENFALSTVTSGVALAHEKAKPFIAFRQELGKQIARP